MLKIKQYFFLRQAPLLFVHVFAYLHNIAHCNCTSVYIVHTFPSFIIIGYYRGNLRFKYLSKVNQTKKQKLSQSNLFLFLLYLVDLVDLLPTAMTELTRGTVSMVNMALHWNTRCLKKTFQFFHMAAMFSIWFREDTQ